MLKYLHKYKSNEKLENSMKNILRITAFLLILTLAIPIFIVSAEENVQVRTDLRGVWVATVINMDYPSVPTTDSETLKSEAVAILDNAKNTGFNTVFLQVRPSGDAIYKSQYFPWSKYLTGTQGLAPGDNFDPLEFWVSEAHKRGIELHAWINPYRVTKKLSTDPEYDYNSLDPNNPAKLHPDWVVNYTDGNIYFNPGLPEVRSLIINSILEIISNYAIDGIHFDDYFYPGKDFNDKDSFERYGSAYTNIGDWRRSNVDMLISDLSSAIKGAGKNIRFGISPFGIWANKKKNPLGSDTKGMQSYYDHYADTRKWVKEGLWDYIVPQVYWSIGYSVADYSKLLSWWNETVSGTAVDLYIGQAAYRAGYSDPYSPWYGVSEIERQLKLNAKTPEVKGSIFFNYKALENNPALKAVIKAYYEQKDGVTAEIPVSISWPSENIRTDYEAYYLNGASDPEKPLFLNGIPVENRSSQGYFGILAPLEPGSNIFTFSQAGSYQTRVIYRNSVSKTPKKMNAVEILKTSVFPQSQEYRNPGEKIAFSCIAPVGSRVTVKIGGKSFIMTPSSTVAYGSGVYPSTYSYEYTIPTYKGSPRNIDLGAPVYKMTYKGKTQSRTAPAKVGVIMKNSRFYGRVIKDVIDTYNIPSSSNGAALELYKGMTDYITGMTGNYVRLSSGQWVRKSSIHIYSSKTQLKPVIRKATYKTGEKLNTLQLDISAFVAATASFDGTSLKLNVPATASLPAVVVPKDTVISDIGVSKESSGIKYNLTLKENQRIEGYYIEKTSTGLALKIKKQAKEVEGDKPLAGITVMLDPGHGGSEFGATGPLGVKYPEKTINLKTALKLRTELESLGAKVLMTRTTDKTVSLEARLAASRTARPDIFISIHANSMAYNVDISKVGGFSVFYREDLARYLAGDIQSNIIGSMGRNDKGIGQRNFYVTRGTWTPSVLIESGFVPNPVEFEWLTDESRQTELVQRISDAIVKYFSK
jgi:uncharacterized lipoprotein YddW (UPF0748 family)/N-acetylmuramoyl-L-alanine amidase